MESDLCRDIAKLLSRPPKAKTGASNLLSREPRLVRFEELRSSTIRVLRSDRLGNMALEHLRDTPDVYVPLLTHRLEIALEGESTARRTLERRVDRYLESLGATTQAEYEAATEAGPSPSKTPKGRSPRSDGKHFERDVAQLLGAPHRQVNQETLVGHKRVDLIVSETRLGKTIRTAVECKDWASPLSIGALTQVWAEYGPLLQIGKIDEVLVVARSGFSPAARAFSESQSGLYVQDYTELIHDALDFRPYARTLIAAYESSEDGLSEYFTAPSTGTGQNLVELLRQWIRGTGDLDANRPVAILGAYGIGKTSVSRHLAAVQARAFLEENDRAPIHIRLGEIAGEQTLEGLLGAHFTAAFPVARYSFAEFQRLNSAGRFLIILDGFDEMKQLLSWEQFRYNIRMLNRLCTANSRVIILGRPTAFESDSQQRDALHGRREVNGIEYAEPDWPDYQEIRIEPFSTEQIEEFLEKYWAFLGDTRPNVASASEAVRGALGKRRIRDLARRPVQLKMLADVLPGYTGVIDDLDEGVLYDTFIDHLIDLVMQREADKLSRLAFTREQRRKFLRSVAYWLWVSDLGIMVDESELPDALFVDFVGQRDLPAVRRDLTVGSPLDRKPGERISFPHKSFQEFLVSEEIWIRLRDRTLTPFEADGLITDEVAAFLIKTGGKAEVEAAQDGLRGRGGLLSERSLRAFWPRPQTGETQEFAVGGQSDDWAIISWISSARETGMIPPEVGSGYSSMILRLLGCLVSDAILDQQIASLLSEILRPLDPVAVTERAVEEGSVSNVTGSFVGTFSRSRMQLGTVVGRGRIAWDSKARRGKIIGGDRLRVAWYPSFAMEAAERMTFAKRGGGEFDMDLRGLRSLIAKHFENGPFVREWLAEGPSLSADLKSAARLPLARQELHEEVGHLLDAARLYRDARNSRLRERFVTSWTPVEESM